MPSIKSTYKTRMCEFYLKNSCMKGDKCPYAHGEHELRSRPSAARRPPLPATFWDFVSDELAANEARSKSCSSGSDDVPCFLAAPASERDSGDAASISAPAPVQGTDKPSILVDASSMAFDELVAYAEGLLVTGAASARGATCTFRARTEYDAAMFVFHLDVHGIEASRVGEFVIVDFRARDVPMLASF